MKKEIIKTLMLSCILTFSQNIYSQIQNSSNTTKRGGDLTKHKKAMVNDPDYAASYNQRKNKLQAKLEQLRKKKALKNKQQQKDSTFIPPKRGGCLTEHEKAMANNPKYAASYNERKEKIQKKIDQKKKEKASKTKKSFFRKIYDFLF